MFNGKNPAEKTQNKFKHKSVYYICKSKYSNY